MSDHRGPKRIVAVAQVDSFQMAVNGGKEGRVIGVGVGVEVAGAFVGDKVGNIVLWDVGVGVA